MYKNSWEIAGFLGTDPVYRQANGKHLAEINVGIKTKTGFGNEIKYDTTWVKATIWGNDALVVTSGLQKGDNVMVSGKHKLNQYQNRNGEPVTEITMQAYRVTRVQDIKYKEPQEIEQLPVKNIIKTPAAPVVKPPVVAQPVQEEPQFEVMDDSNLPF